LIEELEGERFIVLLSVGGVKIIYCLLGSYCN